MMDKPIHLCFGDNSTSPAQSCQITWIELIHLLQVAQRIERTPDKDTKIYKTPWIAPMILKPGETKKEKINILSMSNFMCFDIDSVGWTAQRLCDRLKDLAIIVYTTTLSTIESPRWRVILRTNRYMTTSEYISVWHYVNQTYFDKEVDPKTKNENRLSYMPASWIGADNQFYTHSGTELDIDIIMQQSVKYESETITPIVQLRGKPSQKTIITPNMDARYRTRSKGGRLYDMMCCAAKRHKINGWALNASDLAAAALLVSQSVEPGLPRPNILGEAAKAIGWAETNITTLTEMEKLRSRIQWSLRNNFKDKQ